MSLEHRIFYFIWSTEDTLTIAVCSRGRFILFFSLFKIIYIYILVRFNFISDTKSVFGMTLEENSKKELARFC